MLPESYPVDFTSNTLGRTGQILGQPLPQGLAPLQDGSSTNGGQNSTSNSTSGSSGSNVQKIPINDTYNCYICTSRPAINATNLTYWSWNPNTNECVPDFNRTNPFIKDWVVIFLQI